MSYLEGGKSLKPNTHLPYRLSFVHAILFEDGGVFVLGGVDEGSFEH